MSDYFYRNPITYSDGSMIGVKCDSCGEKFRANITGFEYGSHKKIAMEAGWFVGKINDKWTDLCPDCYETYKKMKRNSFFSKLIKEGE